MRGGELEDEGAGKCFGFGGSAEGEHGFHAEVREYIVSLRTTPERDF